MTPGDFRLPRHVPGGWEIKGHAYAENPRYTVPRWASELVQTWLRLRAARGASAAGVGPIVLPISGGMLEQPALAIEAFELFDHWLTELKRNET